jgi:hypothetical protein
MIGEGIDSPDKLDQRPLPVAPAELAAAKFFAPGLSGWFSQTSEQRSR